MSFRLLSMFILGWSLIAQAQAETYNRVDFQVEVSREVSNDLFKTSLSVEMQDAQPAKVAQHLNSVLNAALKRAAAYKNVKVSSGSQNSYPVYGENNRIDAWRGHAELHIESSDFKAAGELVMQLQKDMQLSDVQFTLSTGTRDATTAMLTAEAIKAFQARAEVIRRSMGAKDYKTLHLTIREAGLPPRYPVAMMRSSAAAESDIPAPEFASGETKLTIQIDASIALH